MNEEELAQWFERRRGDTSLWSETPAKANVRRGGSVVFSVRFSPEELILLRGRAQESGTTISHLVRSAALQAVAAPSPVYALTVDQILQPLTSPAGLRVSYQAVLPGSAALESEEQIEWYISGLRHAPRSTAGPLPVGV